MKGLYIGAAGMMNYMQHIQVHSNNVANAQTPGFKFDQLTSEVISRNKVNYQNGPVTRQVGTIDYGVRPAATHINLTAGSSYITNRDRDFFMQDTDPTQGSNFFITAKNGEISLSRGGQFHSDQFGFGQRMAPIYSVRLEKRFKWGKKHPFAPKQMVIYTMRKQVNTWAALELNLFLLIKQIVW
ncbi:Flagellar hook protein flgE [Listeria monocytogenes N53-1]|nr:Flagellar hook protein flgE [Listeria monocytogenes N53-1]